MISECYKETNQNDSFVCLQIPLYYFWASDKYASTIASPLAGSVCLPFSNTGKILFHLSPVYCLFFCKN